MKQITPRAVPSARPAAANAPRISAPATSRKLSTDEFAEWLHVKSQTIRAGLCRDGHYLGLRPVKLPNRRLLWDSSEVRELLERSA